MLNEMLHQVFMTVVFELVSDTENSVQILFP